MLIPQNRYFAFAKLSAALASIPVSEKSSIPSILNALQPLSHTIVFFGTNSLEHTSDIPRQSCRQSKTSSLKFTSVTSFILHTANSLSITFISIFSSPQLLFLISIAHFVANCNKKNESKALFFIFLCFFDMNNLNKIFILSEQNQSDYIHTAHNCQFNNGIYCYTDDICCVNSSVTRQKNPQCKP